MKKIFAALLAVAFTVAAVCLGACGGSDTVKTPLSMQLNRDEVRLYEDGQIKLEAIISPVTAGSAQLTWESDNTAVATVNEGVVTAVGVGTANITVTAGQLTDTCVVHVDEKTVGVSQIALNYVTLQLEKGDTLTAFDRAEGVALVRTRSANSRVTDSAAAATAGGRR